MRFVNGERLFHPFFQAASRARIQVLVDLNEAPSIGAA